MHNEKDGFDTVPENFGWNLMSYFSWHAKGKDSQSMKITLIAEWK